MKRLLFFGLTTIIFAACSKDKFKTVPQVEIQSFGPEEVTKGQLIQFVSKVSDKEGDIQDSVVFCRKVYSITGTLLSTDSLKYTLKEFGIPTIKQQSYDLQLTLVYGEQRPELGPIQNNSSGVDRNLTIGVYVKDKAGNRSDYVESEKIVLKKI